jgi:hypothetical protein
MIDAAHSIVRVNHYAVRLEVAKENKENLETSLSFSHPSFENTASLLLGVADRD